MSLSHDHGDEGRLLLASAQMADVLVAHRPQFHVVDGPLDVLAVLLRQPSLRVGEAAERDQLLDGEPQIDWFVCRSVAMRLAISLVL